MSRRPMTPTEIRAYDLHCTARHEAGHAVAAALLDRDADYVEVTITDIPDEDLGHTRSVTGQLVGCRSGEPSVALAIWRARPVCPGSAASRRLAVAAAVRMLLAGEAALSRDPETPVSEQWDSLGGLGDGDFQKVTEIVSGVLGPKHDGPWNSALFSAAVDEEWRRTLSALALARKAVDRVARTLRRREYLDWEEVLDLIDPLPRAAVERMQEGPTWTKWAAPGGRRLSTRAKVVS